MLPRARDRRASPPSGRAGRSGRRQRRRRPVQPRRAAQHGPQRPLPVRPALHARLAPNHGSRSGHQPSDRGRRLPSRRGTRATASPLPTRGRGGRARRRRERRGRQSSDYRRRKLNQADVSRSRGGDAMSRPVVRTDGRARVLADGSQIPLLGLGVGQVPNGPECVDAVRWALELGYRHIDTAQAYGNEESVGEGLRESGVPREEVFVTTKFNPGRRDPVAEVERSLERLGVERVDLYIVHWPGGGPTWAWPGMERAQELGYARSIGVSNFDVAELQEVLATASIAPVVN